MPEYRSSVVINFIIRAIIGFTLIFFINQFLSAQGVGVRVGLNPATFVTSGIFGAPGVALLYGISFYQGI
ncbi:pro-sigmaK processing inhibitor BofA family protein [Lachnospiraceae bacterium 50-23]|jgi:pro-sigmaK processing inhibitor BofA|nr:Pro-sigmaK processing inhibitor BofA [Dorea sp.]GFI36452.1 hypothetical protein IMSAGC015_00613 [Lachnospiraceae bacterium]